MKHLKGFMYIVLCVYALRFVCVSVCECACVCVCVCVVFNFNLRVRVHVRLWVEICGCVFRLNVFA